MSLCIKCNSANTVNELSAGGGSIDFSQLYCANCLKEEADSGKFDPIQVPLPEDSRQDQN
jgi:hypothetical protein